jgi:hypothetical protein
MGYLEISDLVKADSFRARLLVGIVHAAGQVLTDAREDKSTAWYNKRIELARNVLRDPSPIVNAFLWPVVSNPTIATKGLDSEDAEILSQVHAVWDIVAGVSEQDKVPDPAP